MGGNVFRNLKVSRVRREDVLPTARDVATRLNLPGLTTEYLMSNLLGSAGKQDESGDMDFAMAVAPPRFVGEADYPVFSVREFSERLQSVLPEGHVNTKARSAGQLFTAWPVAGDFDKGLVQVDFLFGNVEWMRFAMYSPGLDNSEFKGLAMTLMYGVLAKMHKDFELFEDGSWNLGRVPSHLNPYGDPARVARVGLYFDTNKGLYRQYMVSRRKGHGPSRVEWDEFETRVAQSPHFNPLGYVTNPEFALNMLFDRPTPVGTFTNFEGMVKYMKECFNEEFVQVAKERFLYAYKTTMGQSETDRIEGHPLWDQ